MAKYGNAFHEIKSELRQFAATVESAAVIAINSASKKLRTRLCRDIKEATNMKYGTIRKLVGYRGARRRHLSSKIRLSGFPVSAISAGAKWKKKQPVGARVQYWGEKTIPGSFIITGKGEKKVVVTRKGKSRYPLQKVWLPSIADVYRKEKAGELNARINEASKQIESEYYRLVALGKKR